jgi:hypothetical protein
MKRIGASLIVLGSAIGLVVAVFNFFSPTGFLSPLSDTAGTPGALLVIGSTALMLVAGLVLFSLPRSRILVFLALAGTLLDILGTGFAALLLQSPSLLAAMAVAALGWLVWVFSGLRRPSTA